MKAAGKLVAGILMLPVGLALAYLYAQRKPEPFHFYKEPMHGHDVWRLPIIEPHELITADCFAACQGWTYQTAGSGPTNFSSDSINYQASRICFHSEASQSYGFLNIKTNKLTQSLTRDQFADSLQLFGNSSRLFQTTSVYQCWRETGQLPWANEILATQQCGLLKN